MLGGPSCSALSKNCYFGFDCTFAVSVCDSRCMLVQLSISEAADRVVCEVFIIDENIQISLFLLLD